MSEYIQEKKKKVYGVVLFDLISILIPFLNDYNKELVWWFGSVLVFMSVVSIIAILFSSNNSESIKKLYELKKERPIWWNKYDFITDLMIILSWAIVNRLEVGILLIIVKISIMIKLPNYYEKGEN